MRGEGAGIDDFDSAVPRGALHPQDHRLAPLQRHLLDQFGIAMLAGHDLGDDTSALRFKVSTGQLYGASEDEQVRALHATDPTRLPHIAGTLTRIGEAITKLRT